MTTVYIFGAGASKPEGAPLISDFMGKAYEIGYQRNDEKINKIWKFLNDYFGKDPKSSLEANDSYPTIDEITTLIDFAVNNQLSLSAKHTIGELYELKKSLTCLISLTINHSVKQNNIHYKFIQNLFKKKRPIYLISLNYDTLLDKSIITSYKNKSLDNINYGFSSNLTTNPKFNLLKLHGSLNWALCPFCQSIKVVEEPIAHLLYDSFETCSSCSNNYAEPVIITPTLLKSYNIQRLNNVWLAASQAISIATRLVFIGYSLALSDYPIINLIKNSISQRNLLKEVTIIGVPVDKEVVGKRFSKIFGNNITISFDSNGFNGQTYWA